MITVGSIFVCLCFSIIITIYLSWILSSHAKLARGMKLIFWGLAIILLRMLVPINFPFTIAIPITHVLPAITEFLYKLRVGVSIFEIFLFLTGIGAVVKFIYMKKASWLSYRKFVCYLERDTERIRRVSKILKDNSVSNIRVAIIPDRVSPAITGLIHPMLILPEWALEKNKGLEHIVKHEIEHYKNYDLWLKALVDFLECMYWWNPFIYILKRKMYLVMELSNDRSVIKDLTTAQMLEYTEHLLAAAKSVSLRLPNTIPFFYNCNDLQIRVAAIIDVALKGTLHRKERIILNILAISLMIFCGFVLVPEAYKVPNSVEQSSFTVSEDNAYLIQTSSGYDLYMNDTYVASIENIDDSFNNLEIKKEDSNEK